MKCRLKKPCFRHLAKGAKLITGKGLEEAKRQGCRELIKPLVKLVLTFDIVAGTTSFSIMTSDHALNISRNSFIPTIIVVS